MNRIFTITITVATALAGMQSVAGAEQVSARNVLEKFKTFDGQWQSEAVPADVKAGDPEPMPKVDHRFDVTGGGNVVVETMFRGTPSEMINMIHLDGDDLLLTHYCAAGNQPRMRLNREKSTPGHLVFDFVGGTNLDAETDGHIHNAEVFLLDEDHIRSEWTGYDGGKPVSVAAFDIRRVE